MSTRPNPTLRKPVQRAFAGRLVGMRPEPEDIPIQAQAAQQPITQAQATVSALMDAVDAADTDEQVKQAIRNTFQTPTAPVKRGRGRPRKYSGTTVQQRDAERKRTQRAGAKLKLIKLLRCFKLEWDSVIPPGLKTKYGFEVNTYRELLESDKTQAEVFKEIIRELKMVGAIKTPASTKMSSGRYMTDAPRGRGELVVTDNVETIDGVRTGQHQSLSKPTDFYPDDPDDFYWPKSSLDPETLNVKTAGDRRRKQPDGHGPDEVEPGPE